MKHTTFWFYSSSLTKEVLTAFSKDSWACFGFSRILLSSCPMLVGLCSKDSFLLQGLTTSFNFNTWTCLKNFSNMKSPSVHNNGKQWSIFWKQAIWWVLASLSLCEIRDPFLHCCTVILHVVRDGIDALHSFCPKNYFFLNFYIEKRPSISPTRFQALKTSTKTIIKRNNNTTSSLSVKEVHWKWCRFWRLRLGSNCS